MLGSLPAGAVAHLEVRVGSFVAAGAPLLSVWPATAEEETDDSDVNDAFAVGPERTMQEDLAFGIRQLVDIGLRALSPGMNDATTAYEVVVHLGAVLRTILVRDLPSPLQIDDRGTTLLRVHDFTHEDYVRRAFQQLRSNLAGQPGLVVALCNVLGVLTADLDAAGLADRTAPLREQARLAAEASASAGVLPEDEEQIRDTLTRYCLDRENPQGGAPVAVARRGH